MESEQFRKDMYYQTNQASVDYSKMIFNSAFLLNGAAATALLASKIKTFYCAAIFFGFGALSALIGMGLSYAYIMLLAETWRQEPKDFESNGIRVYVLGKWRNLSLAKIENLRLVPLAAAVLSILIFCFAMSLLALAPWPSENLPSEAISPPAIAAPAHSPS